MSDILLGLNEAQHEAVTVTNGPVLVLAGPGSGKTRVLTNRIAWLIQEIGVPPWRIMAVTFTNKATREMRSRVEQLLGGSLKGITLGTFHAVCARILRREAEHLPFSNDYVIYDTADQRALMKIVVTVDLDLDEKRYPPQRIQHYVSSAKNELVVPEQYPANSYSEEITKRAYERYQARLLANNAVDFDDLLMYTTLLFDEKPEVLGRYQNQYDYILVDEFQDTNSVQYVLINKLAERHHNLFCVGDEDQSIYRWRGADYRNVLRLRESYPDLRTILLEHNYRSTQVILDVARAVIDRNPHRTPKRLFTERQGGAEVVCHEAYSEVYEAQFVVDTIASLVAAGEVEPGGCAVMYRTNAQSRAIEDAFVRANLPYRLVGATRFYNRREIKDVMAYLRVIHTPDDDISMLRMINTPPRGIGQKTLDTLQTWANRKKLSLYGVLDRLRETPDSAPLSGRARNALLRFIEMLEGWRQVNDDMPVGDLLKLVLDETEYREYIDDGTEEGEERWANVVELVNVAAEYEELSLTTFLEEVSLVSDVDNLPEGVNAPTLLTLHAAKGLEYDVVFIVGLEEGILPHSRSFDDPEAMAEERRLCYVGITRARNQLYLVSASQRMAWGGITMNMPSRFLSDIPANLLMTIQGMPSGIAYQRATTWSGGPPRIKTQFEAVKLDTEYKTGQRVLHPKFGQGTVIESRLSGGDEEVSVAFDRGGVKRLMASFANLEVLDS